MKLPQSKFIAWFKIINEKKYLRFLVCVVPGILLTQLSLKIGLPGAIRIFATSWTIVGAVVFISWDKIFSRLPFFESIAENTESAPLDQQTLGTTLEYTNSLAEISIQSSESAAHAKLVEELVQMCDGDAAKALKHIQEECSINPHESYLAAIQRAHRRQEFFTSAQSENSNWQPTQQSTGRQA